MNHLTSAILSAFEENWAVCDWYIDPDGLDSNSGTDKLHPISAAELMRRLAVPVPIKHSIGIHCTTTNQGFLSLKVIFAERDCHLVIKPAYTLNETCIGTVESWLPRSHQTGVGEHLCINGIENLAPYIGNRLRIEETGAISWILSCPTLVGARIGRTSIRNYEGNSWVESPIAPEQHVWTIAPYSMPRFDCLQIEIQARQPVDSGNRYEHRLCEILDLDIGTLVTDCHVLRNGNSIIADGCRIGTVLHESTTGAIRFYRCRITNDGETNGTMTRVAFVFCVFMGPSTSGYVFNQVQQMQYCTVQGVRAQFCMGYPYDTQFFDSPSEGFIMTAYPPISRLGPISGTGHASYGLRISAGQTWQYKSASPPNVKGNQGDIRLVTSGVTIPYTALPWNDGERHGTATLCNGDALVEVPYILPNQLVMVGHGESPPCGNGVLSAVYVDNTHIKISSTNPLDNYLVVWHILPVGNKEHIVPGLA